MLAIIFFVFVVFLAVLGMSFQMYLLCLCFVFVSACIVGGRVKEGAWSLCVLAEVFVVPLFCISY